MAKKAAVTLDLPNIKLADSKKSKTDKPERLTIDSPKVTEDMTEVTKGYKGDVIVVVDQAIRINQQIESLETELGGFEKILKDTAATAKNAEIKADNFVKTVDIAGTDHKIQIQFRDAYSKMDISMKDPLNQIFGDKFRIMFDVTEPARVETLRTDKQAELKALLGARYTDFFDITNVDGFVKPTSDFQHNYFALRKSLKADQVATVQKVLDACQSSPAVKYPK
jgi:hypothetical protein